MNNFLHISLPNFQQRCVISYYFYWYFKVIGQFIARAIADDCIAPKYVMKFKGTVDDEHKQAALDKAELLLSRKHGIVRLDNIWGTGGGIRPVKYLVKQVCFYKTGFFLNLKSWRKKNTSFGNQKIVYTTFLSKGMEWIVCNMADLCCWAALFNFWTLFLSLLLQMVLLLKEFLSSGDVAEATRCLQELEVPHFHHELVYEVSVY